MNEHLHTLEERVQQLTGEYDNRMEEKLQQFSDDCNKKIRLLAQQLGELKQDGQHRYKALQLEAARRHEESVRKHEQLLKLLITQAQASSPSSIGNSSTMNTSVIIREGKQPAGSQPRGSTNKGLGEDRGKGLLPSPHR